ncbi:hypothetical protein QQ020_03855 [Fulvivirgaceae bacterium BMA12]|uniref:Uncharacterized protein n=1 Tax=Agaribacillus aureus TaxID=3051825 RepID=A0ABT8L0A6_9BACT|nr:hypothetical protein [Fulvivirgaceae bacterium BMA12]
MNNQLKLSDFGGKILGNAILLGPIAMVLFLVVLFILNAEVNWSPKDWWAILFFGSLLCIFISFGASIFIYGTLVLLALRKQGTALDHFTRFLPVLIVIFPLASSAMLFSLDGYSPFPLAIVISAYLTSVLGWYWLSRSIAKKQSHFNLPTNQ